MAHEPSSPPSSSVDDTATKPPQAGSAASRAPLLAAILAVAVPGSLAALWLAPRPAHPAEMPPLVVPANDAQATLAAIARSASSALADDDATEARRRTLYLEQGMNEARPSATPQAARLRDEELAQLAVELDQAGALDAIRARDVGRTMTALRASGDAAERLGEIGSLPDALVRYGAVVDGRRVAPVIVVEAMAWARWNGIHQRALTEGMDRTMLRAYHGWLVYYGPTEGTELRDGALVELVRAGGLRGLETEGFLRLSRNDRTGARLAFETAYEATGNVRLRNHALALGLAELGEEDPGPVGGGS